MNQTIYDEIIPTLSLPQKELEEFAAAVTERFNNPFVDHALLDISLNSTSKWKARVMPSLKGYVEKFGKLPVCITASFAFYIAFCRGSHLTENGLQAVRGEDRYLIRDDREVLEFFYEHRNDNAKMLANAVCRNTKFWGEDLTDIKGFEDAVAGYLDKILRNGSYEVMKECI